MENYIIDDYLKSVSEDKVKGKRKRDVLRRRALELWDKDIGASEIAEILELTEKQLKELLGVERIEKGHKSATIKAKEKLTPRRVNRLASDRDKQIIELSKTINMEKVAEMLNISLELVKERYLALGLPIYTEEELRKMAEAEKERKMKNKEEKPKGNRVEAQKPEEQESVKADVNQQKPEEEKIDLNNFEEVKRKIHESISEKNIERATGIAKRAIEQGNFGDKEKGKLQELVDLIETIRKRRIGKRRDIDESSR